MLIAVLAALALTVAVYGIFRREATRTTGRNVSILRIADSETIPDDLTGVRYLLLDATSSTAIRACACSRTRTSPS